MLARGYFMALSWFVYTLCILFFFSKPQMTADNAEGSNCEVRFFLFATDMEPEEERSQNGTLLEATLGGIGRRDPTRGTEWSVRAAGLQS